MGIVWLTHTREEGNQQSSEDHRGLMFADRANAAASAIVGGLGLITYRDTLTTIAVIDARFHLGPGAIVSEVRGWQ